MDELNEIPSLNRNFTSYLSTLPGITATLSTDSFGADSIRVNGQATQNANYMLDGAGNNDNFNNGNGGAQARTPVEAVQEFQLLTGQFDAEFGPTSGGVVNAVSKQGTNQFHGVAFFFNQNESMTSLDYFAKQQGSGETGSAAEAVGRQPRWTAHQEQAALLRQPGAHRPESRANDQHQRPAGAEFHGLYPRQRLELDGCASIIKSMPTTRGPFAGCGKRHRRAISTQRRISREPSAEKETDTDWTMVGTLNSVLSNTRVNTLKISYTHEDVFFGNPGYFETERPGGTGASALAPDVHRRPQHAREPAHGSRLPDR